LEFSFKDYLFEELGVALNQAGLLKSSKEMLSGLLFGIKVGPLESEVLLEFLPDAQVVRNAISIIVSCLLC
jgi:hypothetical protein